MTDDELKRSLESTVSEIRRHFDASSESLRAEIRAVAEAVGSSEEKVQRELQHVRGELRQGFAETQSMINFHTPSSIGASPNWSRH